MRGYLLDTNIIEFWFNSNKNKQKHDSVLRRIDALDPNTPLATSVVVLGEIEYGYESAPHRREHVGKVLRFVQTQLPRILKVTLPTAQAYGQLRAALFDKYAPKKDRKGLRPEQLTDPITSKELGIQENDLWIAAQALERNLVLVTDDKMDRIRTVAQKLKLENWARTDNVKRS